ncbi:hypothetical protein INR49_017859 [Caranx melampygus]|nr:hypothetical protein INR49_017859 [Caranx melampygus]
MAAGKGAENPPHRGTTCGYASSCVSSESSTRGDYGQGDKKEKFKFARTLVFIQCIINALFAKILIQFFEGSKPDHTKSWLYGLCSLSYLGAMVSSNSALQYVNYPTQVLGKSCKPIPVMILGVTILRKRYPLAKYLCVLLIVSGVALFLYKPNKSSAVADDHIFGFGEILLDHMRARFQTGANHMMLNINMWSTLVLGLAVLWTGEVWEFLSFTERHPSILYNILLFGLTSALGQWVGTVLVFLGLGLDAKFGKGPKKTTH